MYAIWQQSIPLAIVYFIFAFVGIFVGVLHLWVRPRCPHLKEHDSCSQLPTFMSKMIIKKNVHPELSLSGKIGSLIVLHGVYIIPIYWVIISKSLIIPYFAFVAEQYGILLFKHCKEFLNIACPRNRNKMLKEKLENST
jgi:disulfide bond formation protein DsbB